MQRDPALSPLSQRFPVSVKGVIVRDGAVALLRNEREEWELPGGKLDPRESPEVCLEREVKEELQLRVDAASILDCWVYAIAPDALVLIVTYGCNELERLEAMVSDEHSEAAWIPLGNVSKLVMPDGYKESIHRWADHVARM